MPLGTTTKILQYWHEVQAIVAVIFGMLVQYYYGEKHKRLIISVAISSAFVALFLVPAFIEIANHLLSISLPNKIQIKPDGSIAIMLYAISSLISVHIIAMITVLLPAYARSKVEKIIGLKEIDDDTKQ